MADRARTYDPTFVEQLRETLAEKAKEPPPRRQYTTREVVRQMREEIRGMERAGWTREQIVEVLRDQGFQVTVNTLRTYLRDTTKAGEIAGQRPSHTGSSGANGRTRRRGHSGFDEDV